MRQAVRYSGHAEYCDCNLCMERRYPRRQGHFWTWMGRPGSDDPSRVGWTRALTVAGAMAGLALALAVSWWLLLLLVATAFILLVSAVLLLATSWWPWAVLAVLGVAALLLRRTRRPAVLPREPRDLRELL